MRVRVRCLATACAQHSMSHLGLEGEARADVRDLALQPLRSKHVLQVRARAVLPCHWEGRIPAIGVRQADELRTNGQVRLSRSPWLLAALHVHFVQPALLGQRIARGQRRFATSDDSAKNGAQSSARSSDHIGLY